MGKFLKELFEQYARRLLTTKVRPSISEEGIMTIPNNKRVEKMAVSLYEDFQKAGVPDNILKTENDIKVFHHKIAEINNENMAKQFDTLISESTLFNPKKPADVFDLKGNKIKNTDNIMGGEEIKELDPALYEDRGGNIIPAQFKNETEEQIKKRLMDQNKKSLDSMKKKLDEPDDMATGGRAGYYGGGQAMVGKDLSDIGHGSDALMARNMQVAPGGQATTSTGLNYLLGQDNDTVRIPYNEGKKVEGPNPKVLELMLNEKMSYPDALKELKIREKQQPYIDQRYNMGPGPILEAAEGGRIGYNKGKAVKEVADKGRRGFMKAAGATTAGIAALKTGLLGFGEKVAPVAKEAVEAVSNTAGQIPPYFWKLVEKIKNLGDDAPKLATQDRQKVTTYKDFEMTEDVSTGEIQIFKNSQSDEAIDRFASENANEEVFMRYKPSEKILLDEANPGGGVRKTMPEYEENTSYISNNRENTGEILEEVSGVPDDIFLEVGEELPEIIRKTKADGGRIGFNKGKAVKELIKAGEGKFTKAQYLIERIKNTIKGSPDDKYVQETFPNFIKELEANPDLAKNENVFKELGGDLPEGQQIVVYGDDTLDFFTTSSGPQNIQKLENFMAKHDLPKDQALRIMKMEPNDQVMELTKTKFIKQKRTDNSSGGLAAMLGE
jgi:hypothetical protein